MIFFFFLICGFGKRAMGFVRVRRLEKGHGTAVNGHAMSCNDQENKDPIVGILSVELE